MKFCRPRCGCRQTAGMLQSLAADAQDVNSVEHGFMKVHQFNAAQRAAPRRLPSDAEQMAIGHRGRNPPYQSRVASADEPDGEQEEDESEG